MAPPKPPKSKAGFANRLTAKVGPLPVWGWAAAILGAYLLYTRLRPASAAVPATDTTATPDTSGDTGSQVPASGQGSAADNLNGTLLDQLGANTSSIDALTSQLLQGGGSYSYGDAPAAGTPQGAVAQDGPASSPTVATHPVAVGGNVSHATQTQSGSLSWGGQTFTSKVAFDAWAKAHGSSTNAELKQHPQAKAIYSTLR